MRKMISFKLENFPDKQRKIVDDWANNQSNIQQSLLNIVMHVVSVAGYDDVMDFEIQRKLHLTLGGVNPAHTQQSVQPIQTAQPVQYVDNSNEHPVYDVDNEPSEVEKNSDVEHVYKKADWFNDEE